MTASAETSGSVAGSSPEAARRSEIGRLSTSARAPHPRGLPGAAVVTGPLFQEAGDKIKDVVALRAIGCFSGVPGIGKSFSASFWSCQFDVEALIFRANVASGSGSQTKRMAQQMYFALTGQQEDKAFEIELLREAQRLLGDRDRIIVVDEAQKLHPLQLDLLVHWQEDESARFALLLVGGRKVRDLLRERPHLEDRLARELVFRPLGKSAFRETAHAYHDVYRDADADVLDYLDATLAHGKFRKLAQFTQTLLPLVSPGDKLRRIDVDLVVKRMQGGATVTMGEVEKRLPPIAKSAPGSHQTDLTTERFVLARTSEPAGAA